MMRVFPIPTALALTLVCVPAAAEVVDLPIGGFQIVHETVVPGAPDAVYDEFTGDVSGWWDHHMSEEPAALVIEARPGGHFYEYFDESGQNGVIHATVIYAERGRKLVFDGPLGMNGHPLSIVTTCEFALEGPGRTRVTVTCRAAGELQEGWPEAVDGVWHHFLIERFRPYMESLAHGG